MIENPTNNTTYFNRLAKDRNYYFELGDEKQPKKKEKQLKINTFDNDANLSVRILDEGMDYEIEEEAEKKKVTFVTVIPHKPEDNLIAYSIRYKNIIFCKQPTMIQYTADTGLECFIPEDMEGGYICFYSNPQGRRVGKPGQGTGEVFQLPRPKAIDSNGLEALCDIDINDNSNSMIVTMPVDFYSNAVYPVRVK